MNTLKKLLVIPLVLIFCIPNFSIASPPLRPLPAHLRDDFVGPLTAEQQAQRNARNLSPNAQRVPMLAPVQVPSSMKLGPATSSRVLPDGSVETTVIDPVSGTATSSLSPPTVNPSNNSAISSQRILGDGTVVTSTVNPNGTATSSYVPQIGGSRTSVGTPPRARNVPDRVSSSTRVEGNKTITNEVTNFSDGRKKDKTITKFKNGNRRVVTKRYDADGNLVATRRRKQDGTVIRKRFDRNGNLLSETTIGPDGRITESTLSNESDSVGSAPANRCRGMFGNSASLQGCNHEAQQTELSNSANGLGDLVDQSIESSGEVEDVVDDYTDGTDSTQGLGERVANLLDEYNGLRAAIESFGLENLGLNQGDLNQLENMMARLENSIQNNLDEALVPNSLGDGIEVGTINSASGFESMLALLSNPPTDSELQYVLDKLQEFGRDASVQEVLALGDSFQLDSSVGIALRDPYLNMANSKLQQFGRDASVQEVLALSDSFQQDSLVGTALRDPYLNMANSKIQDYAQNASVEEMFELSGTVASSGERVFNALGDSTIQSTNAKLQEFGRNASVQEVIALSRSLHKARAVGFLALRDPYLNMANAKIQEYTQSASLDELTSLQNQLRSIANEDLLKSGNSSDEYTSIAARVNPQLAPTSLYVSTRDSLQQAINARSTGN